VKAFLQVGEDVVLYRDAIQVALEKDPIAETALIVINRHHRSTRRRITEGSDRMALEKHKNKRAPGSRVSGSLRTLEKAPRCSM
jgi:hypothetical protein